MLFCSFLASISIVGISYYFVSYFLGKRERNQEWHRKIASYRKELIEKYNAQPVTMTSDDGIALSGLLFLRKNAKRTMLLCHGWLMNKERLRPFASMFEHDNMLFFDFRAHGESQGNYTSIGHHEKNDVIAAFKFLQTHPETKHLPIFGLGISMGAVSLVSAAATGLPFAGIIVDSAFGSLDQVIADTFTRKTGFPTFPFATVCQKLYDYFAGCPAESVGASHWLTTLEVPLLIIHSKQDYLARFDVCKKLYEQAKTCLKNFWIVENGIHGRIHKDQTTEYSHQVSQFLHSVEDYYASNSTVSRADDASSVVALNNGSP